MPLFRRMEITPETGQDAAPAQPLSVVAAFVAVAWVGIGASVLPLGSQEPREMAVLGVSVAVCTVLFALALRRRGRPSVLHVLAPLAFLPVVAVTREIMGGSGAGTVSLLLVPVLWLALTGTPRQLVVAGVCTLLTIALPIVLVGPPSYPSGEWRRVVVTAAIITLIVPLVQRLVRRLSYERERAESTVVHLDGIMRGTAGTSMVSCNLDGTIRFFNVGAEELLGRRREDVVGRVSIAELHDPRELEVVADELGASGPVEALAALAATGASHTLTYRRADGSSVLVRLTMTVLRDEDGDVTGYLAVAQDTTQEVEAAQALEQANNQFRRLFTDAPHGVAVLDTAGRVVLINRALRSILGLSSEGAHGIAFGDLAPPGDGSVADHLARVVEADGASVGTDCVLRNQRGLDVHVALSSRLVRQGHGSADVVFVNVVDVSERLRYQEQLSHLVDHDVLTGLANRRRFDTELTRRLAGFRLHRRDGALLLLDLDHFKQVNDTSGHNAGDQLLIDIALVLGSAVRAGDLVARLGGDEFALLLADVDQAGAEVVAAKVVEAISRFTSSLDAVARRVTCSVGVVTFRAAAEHDADLMALADMTMYDAKEAGRDRYAVLPEGGGSLPAMGVHLEWQRRIEEALEHDRFVILLQPIVDVRTGRVVSAEALLRMRDDDGGLISPARFLHTAERVGLMPRVDVWVIERAVPLLARLRRIRPGLMLEVNLSGQSMGEPSVEGAIVRALEQHPEVRGALILEVTETVAVADVQLARAFADRMTALGCLFALDDFGAGFGSFHYLKHLVFDYVKIDGEFVATLAESEVDRSIVRSMVSIAHELGKLAVAEFVADAEVLRLVREAGVDLAQGYHVGHPMTYDDFVAHLSRHEELTHPGGREA